MATKKNQNVSKFGIINDNTTNTFLQVMEPTVADRIIQVGETVDVLYATVSLNRPFDNSIEKDSLVKLRISEITGFFMIRGKVLSKSIYEDRWNLSMKLERNIISISIPATVVDTPDITKSQMSKNRFGTIPPFYPGEEHTIFEFHNTGNNFLTGQTMFIPMQVAPEGDENLKDYYIAYVEACPQLQHLR